MQAGVVVLLMSFLVFSGVFLVGDPVDILISDEADEEDRERAIAGLGLDKPFHMQYLLFLRGALRGDLGESFIFEEPALLLIVERMPATMELALFALLIAVVIGIPLGMLAGFRPESIAAKTIMSGSILGFSLPSFWVGIMTVSYTHLTLPTIYSV